MKIKALLLFVFALSFQAFSQDPSGESWKKVFAAQSGSLTVNYFENYPFCYKDKNGNLTGVEIDIINEFAQWVKTKKGVDLKLNFVAYPEFGKFYTSTKEQSGGVVGLGSVTITNARMNEIKFTPPYLKNRSLLISSGSVLTLNSMDEITRKFVGMVAISIKGSIHEKELLDIKAKYFPGMTMEYAASATEILDKISNDPKYFGYVDLISYWAYLKNKHSVYIKMQKAATSDDELFCFILPLKTDWNELFAEFFESGFGFTATQAYHKILEKHLGYEVISSVAIE